MDTFRDHLPPYFHNLLTFDFLEVTVDAAESVFLGVNLRR